MATNARKAAASVKPAARTVPKVAAKTPPKNTAKASPPQQPDKPKTKSSPTAGAKANATLAGPGKAELKLVRDSFTMPAIDIARIDQLKRRTLALGRATKKSELLRAGLHALQALPDAQLMAVLSGLAVLKTGRPKKSS